MSIYVKNSTSNPVNSKDLLVASKLDSVISQLTLNTSDDDAIKSAVQSMDAKLTLEQYNGTGVQVCVNNSNPIGVTLYTDNVGLATEVSLQNLAQDVSLIKNNIKPDNASDILWRPTETIVSDQTTPAINTILFGSLVTLFGSYSGDPETIAELRVEYSFTGSNVESEWFPSNNSVCVASSLSFNLDFWTASPYIRVRTNKAGNFTLAYGVRS